MPGEKAALSPLTACIKCADDLTAGVLLYRILYWHPKMRMRRNGKLWIAKSAQEWCDETGLTPKQYKRALAILKQRNLLEISRHLFRGKNVNFYRLSEQALNKLGKAPEGPFKESPEGPPEWSPEGPFHIQGVTQGDTTKSSSPGVVYHPSSEIPGDDGEGDFGEDEKMPTVKDLMNQMSAGKKVGVKGSTPNSTLNASNLATHWKERVSELTGQFQPPTSMKMLGQMKAFQKICPGGSAQQVMDALLDDWVGFVKKVEAEAGLKSVPIKPNFDFVLKHAAAAVDFSKVVATQKPQLVVNDAPKEPGGVQLTSSSVEADEQKMSYAEMLAILNDEGGGED